MKYRETSGERIRRVRLVRRRYLGDKNCDLAAFCRRAGVDEARMMRIESGEVSGILLSEGQKFSETLGVSPEYLMTGERSVEDRSKEEILFSPQVGSMMHAARMAMRKDGNSGLKAIAEKVGLRDMDIMRMESLYRSKYFSDETVLKKLSRVLSLDISDMREAIAGSFPRGEVRKDIAYDGTELVVILKESSRAVRTHRFRAEVSRKDYENIIRRLEFELSLL